MGEAVCAPTGAANQAGQQQGFGKLLQCRQRIAVLTAVLPEQPQAAQRHVGEGGIEKGGETLKFMQQQINENDEKRHKHLPFPRFGGGGRVGNHKESKQVKRRRGKRAHKERLRRNMMAEQPGAQRQLQGVKQQKAADQHTAADIEGKQHQRGSGDKKGRDTRPAPLIGGCGRNHAVAQHQGGNHAEQARVVDMAAVYRENVFGRGGKKRRYGSQPQAVGKIGQHRQAEAGNQAANRNKQGFAPQQIMQQAVQRNANQQNQPDLGRTPVETPKRDAAGNESGLKQQHGQTGIVFGGKAVESNHGKRSSQKKRIIARQHTRRTIFKQKAV